MSAREPLTALEVLVDLFGDDPADLHGAVIPNAPGLAELVVEALAYSGFMIVRRVNDEQ
jgi:hypothetical protein